MELNFVLIGSQVAAGIARGGMYLLLAMGITLIFGVLRIINFAHGAMYMLAVYFSVSLAARLGYWPALIIVPLLLALVGAIIEVLVFRRIYKAEHLIQLLVTYALVYVITDLVKLGWGAFPMSVPLPDFFNISFEVLGIIIPMYYLFIVGLAAILSIGLWVLLHRTKLGYTIRACAMNPEMANALGINVNRVFLIAFVIGSWITGVAAVASAPIIAANLGIGMDIIIICFAVIIVGGVGSFLGAGVGALLIGLAESLGLLVLPQYALVLAFGIMVIVLIVRPWGLLGKPLTT
jgi:branched-subunit amino acid ABC-type transport system permease component